ncbi:MAG: hypothetical protein ACLR8Y_00910 [Alistipes indistinctus]
MMAYWFVRGLFWQFNTFDAVVPFEDFLFFTTGLMLICIVGITDDISGLSYKCKFVFQVVGALLLVLPYCYIDNLQGLFGLYAIPAWAGGAVYAVAARRVGQCREPDRQVDGLCSGLGVLIFSVLSLLNLLAGNAHLALLGACAVGATLVFFMYNVFGRKLKIFMGRQRFADPGLYRRLPVPAIGGRRATRAYRAAFDADFADGSGFRPDGRYDAGVRAADSLR